MSTKTEVEQIRLRNKFENQEPNMRNRNDRHYWLCFSNWIIENHALIAQPKMP